jgi:hypothetical protein
MASTATFKIIGGGVERLFWTLDDVERDPADARQINRLVALADPLAEPEKRREEIRAP